MRNSAVTLRSPSGAVLLPAAGLTQLIQLCFRPLQPIRHAHFTVHRHRGGEVLLGLSAIGPTKMEFAEPQAAVGNERAHAAGLS